MFFLQGKRSPASGGGGDQCPGVNALELTLSRMSSDNLSDFLLTFTFVGSAFFGVECANRDEIEESSTAIV